ncbi:MAG: hypothetical protein ACJARD_000780 [Alphaproteobacteria bacterium]|jgi:hypothetical protein
MSDVRPSNKLSNSRPVNQQDYSLRYNPVIGRRSLQEHNGAFKTLARKAGISSTVGYDPKGQSNFLAQKPVQKSFEGLNVIGNFLKRYAEKNTNDFEIEADNGKQFLCIKGDDTEKHQIIKHKNGYDLIVKKDYRKKAAKHHDNHIRIKIKANDTGELKEKIAWILQNPVSRAKLDYHTPKIIGKKYIDFNENKVVGNFDLQEFKSIGNPNLAEGFQSEIGGVDMHQINYHGPNVSYQGYSSLEDKEKQITKVKDHFWGRVHGMHEHILSSNVVDELLGSIVNMFYAKRGVSAEHRAQLVSNVREDYIFNLFGKGSRNSRSKEDSTNLFDSPTKFQNFLSQIQLASNPNRGGRVWRDIPPSLSQTMALMYHPKGNGDIESVYDKNPQKYLKNLSKLKITIADKQFIASYGRKILGIYLALKFIKHDLSKINIDDKNTSEKQHHKWRDLTQMHDELFESAGDLKDFLRHNSSGFVQVKDSVTHHNIPDIKKTAGINTQKTISKDKYAHIGEKTLYPLMLNYTQFDSFIGLHSHEKGSYILANTLKDQIFDREVPDFVAKQAAAMLLQGVDTISKRLKFIDETVGKDADLKGVVTQLGSKIQQGDLDGAYHLFDRQAKRVTNMLDYEALFPNKKIQALQTEGFLWEKEVIKPITPNYYTQNKNIFIGNHAPVYMIEKNGKILTAKLVEAIKMQARLIKDIQIEMKNNHTKSPYDTQAMKVLSSHMRAAAEQIANKFMKDHSDYFQSLPQTQKDKILNDIFKETYALQELIGNVSCVLATSTDAIYGPKADQDKRNVKRNKKLAGMAGHSSRDGV